MQIKHRCDLIIIAAMGILLFGAPVLAHEEEGGILHKEREGRDIYSKLQTKQATCENLKDADFELVGEYFMGRMMGDGHEAMNAMMKQMMGEAGEKQMHAAMGKRMSECETGASLDTRTMMPMMMSMMGMASGGMMGKTFAQDTSPMSKNVMGTGVLQLKNVVWLSYINTALLGIILAGLILKFFQRPPK